MPTPIAVSQLTGDNASPNLFEQLQLCGIPPNTEVGYSQRHLAQAELFSQESQESQEYGEIVAESGLLRSPEEVDRNFDVAMRGWAGIISPGQGMKTPTKVINYQKISSYIILIQIIFKQEEQVKHLEFGADVMDSRTADKESSKNAPLSGGAPVKPTISTMQGFSTTSEATSTISHTPSVAFDQHKFAQLLESAK